MKRISGLGVALVTPFKMDKSVDLEALNRVVGHVIDGGVDFLVALGTTAETPTLTDDEKRCIVATIVAKNERRVPLVVGVGGNNTDATVKNLADLHSDATAVLSVVPYYNKPSQKGIEAHFTAVADASRRPVILYNVPGRTGVNMSVDTCLRLAEHKNIVALKDASGNLNQLGYILRDKPADFSVLSGDDGLTLAQTAMGADGVISVIANAFPRQFGDMVHSALKGNFAEARTRHLQLMEMMELLFVEGNPSGVKAALSILGLAENTLRLPLTTTSESLHEKLKTAQLKLS